jgi:hypothetical protein
VLVSALETLALEEESSFTLERPLKRLALEEPSPLLPEPVLAVPLVLADPCTLLEAKERAGLEDQSLLTLVSVSTPRAEA